MLVHAPLGTLWLLLVFAHALADYPLQGDFLARGKNPHTRIPGAPWQILLSAHALIHAGFVALLTGSVTLGMLEWFAHVTIDIVKCEGTFGQGERAFTIDQGFHIMCKLVWVILIGMGVR